MGWDISRPWQIVIEISGLVDQDAISVTLVGN